MTIVGYGRTGFDQAGSGGVKRHALTYTTELQRGMVYHEVIEVPGLNSTTCAGDSGGPFFFGREVFEEPVQFATKGGERRCEACGSSVRIDRYVDSFNRDRKNQVEDSKPARHRILVCAAQGVQRGLNV